MTSLPLAISQFLIPDISSVIDCKELKIAQTAPIKQLFYPLN